MSKTKEQQRRDVIRRIETHLRPLIPEIITGERSPLTLFDFLKSFGRKRRLGNPRNIAEREAIEREYLNQLFDEEEGSMKWGEVYNLYRRLFNQKKEPAEHVELREFEIIKYPKLKKASDERKEQVIRFPVKYQIKKYGRHHVSTRGHYQMDLLISDPVYLVVIGVVSRYGYLVPLNISLDERWKVRSARDLITVQDALDSIINRLKKNEDTEKVHLSCDLEKSFISQRTADHFKTEAIIIGCKDNEAHTRLAIINRFIRTIRDEMYKLYGLKDELPPLEMQKVVEDYNLTKHHTLSLLMGFPVSPDMVENDPVLEDEIASRIYLRNSLKDKPEIQIGDEVQIYVAPHGPGKVRRTASEEIFMVQDLKKSEVIIVNKEDPDDVRIVPEWAVR
jgi:hypothetical protein